MAHRIVHVALALLVIAALGCAATRGRKAEPRESGFLGDYSQLGESEQFPERLIYISPDAEWSQYDSILLESVTLWLDKSDDQAALTEEERQMLTDTLYKAMHEKLSERFVIAEKPGGTTIRMRLALTAAKGSPVATRSITTIVPQFLILGTAVGLSRDTVKTVGQATVEADLRDSVTDRRLVALVDQRAGTKNLFSGRTFSKWGDVEAAAQYWAERAADSLTELGVRTRP